MQPHTSITIRIPTMAYLPRLCLPGAPGRATQPAARHARRHVGGAVACARRRARRARAAGGSALCRARLLTMAILTMAKLTRWVCTAPSEARCCSASVSSSAPLYAGAATERMPSRPNPNPDPSPNISPSPNPSPNPNPNPNPNPSPNPNPHRAGPGAAEDGARASLGRARCVEAQQRTGGGRRAGGGAEGERSQD
jgi:hypothetical protein